MISSWNAAPLAVQGRSRSSYPSLVSLVSGRKNNTRSLSLAHNSLSFISLNSGCVRHPNSNSNPPPPNICYLPAWWPCARLQQQPTSQSGSPTARSSGADQPSPPTTAPGTAPSTLSATTHTQPDPPPHAYAANAPDLNRMHDLFQLETLRPGAGAPSNANLHLRLAADDRFHHRGQCILNRATIATSSARRVT